MITVHEDHERDHEDNERDREDNERDPGYTKGVLYTGVGGVFTKRSGIEHKTYQEHNLKR